MSRSIASLLGALLLAACAERNAGSGTNPVAQPDSAVWTPETAWRLSPQPVLTISGSREEVEQAPLDPVAAFRLADGRYVVADGDQNGWDGLLVYDTKGKFLARWGGAGKGPGEFGQLLGWAGVYRDSVAAYDWPDRAFEIFTSAGQPARALRLPHEIYDRRPPRGTYAASGTIAGVFADGSVLRFEGTVIEQLPSGAGPVWYEPELSVYDANGVRLRSLGRFRTWPNWWNGKLLYQYVFGPGALTIAGRDRWYHGRAETFDIDVYDPAGSRLATLHRPFAPQQVTEAERERFISWYIERARGGPEGGAAIAQRVERLLRENAGYAEVKPAYSNLVEDAEGNLWVEHYRWPLPDGVPPDAQPTRWTVFAADDRFLGEVEVPAAFIVSSITRDQVIGFWQDEFDVQHVHVYALIKPGAR